MNDLQKLIQEIAEKQPFNEINYPSLKGKTNEEKFDFSINHNLLHINKQIGRIATYLEANEHGMSHGKEIVYEATIKLVINSLRLAEIQEIDADKIKEGVQKYMK